MLPKLGKGMSMERKTMTISKRIMLACVAAFVSVVGAYSATGDAGAEVGRAPMNASSNNNNALSTVYGALAPDVRKLYDTIFAPVVAGTPPTYAVRDLCVTSGGEIRHSGWRFQ